MDRYVFNISIMVFKKRSYCEVYKIWRNIKNEGVTGRINIVFIL